MRTAPATLTALVLAVGLAACSAPADPGTDPASVPPAESSAPAAEPAPEEPELSVAAEQAQLAAQGYVDTLAMSKKALVEQLTFEDHSEADAKAAADAVTVDWNAEAAESAAGYLDTMPMSATALQEQLEFDGFTPEQAAHGVAESGL